MSRLTLDHDPGLGLGQGEMLGQVEPRDQPLLQARRRHEADATLQESMVRAPQDVVPGQANAPMHGSDKAGASPQE